MSQSNLHITLVGNPNCGKSTLFNALTGADQKIGNWPGVTVDKKTGHYQSGDQVFDIVDLPGTYSLINHPNELSIDEHIACKYILHQPVDCVVNILDASHLERHLYLTLQLLDLNIPVVIALNMMDIINKRGWAIDHRALAKQLGCKVIPICAATGKGLNELNQAIIQQAGQAVCHTQKTYPAKLLSCIPTLQNAIHKVKPNLNSMQTQRIALHLAEMNTSHEIAMAAQIQQAINSVQADIKQQLGEDADIIFADSRYSFIHTLCKKIVDKTKAKREGFTGFLDNIVLNRFLALPLFFLIMYSMFIFAINIGGAFQDFFDLSSQAIFVNGLTQGLSALHCPPWLIAILASGVGKGINTTVTFIPVIGGMFLFLSFLEACGYMARAAFIMDRLMRALGLPGKSFVPMILGFGCNVPSIMAARTLDNQRDRILTIMMSPFMSCGARLAIYAVFASAFFPVGAQNVVFSLYLLGIVMAVLTGWILRKSILPGEPSPFIMEIPPYRMPTFKGLMRATWLRLKRFLTRAGKVIVPVCIVIGALNAMTLSHGISLQSANTNSVLSLIGRHLTILFAPMGIHQDNWPATVGLLTGVLAKEVVIATLNTLYTQVGHLHLVMAHGASIGHELMAALKSIPENLAAIPQAFGNPILASAPVHGLSQQVYGVMYAKFSGQLSAYCYLVFVLLYIPCISTTAVMAKELNKSWAIFSLIWSLFLAYGIAVGIYQAVSFMQHPLQSSLWLVCIALIFLVSVLGLKYKKQREVDYGFNTPQTMAAR